MIDNLADYFSPFVSKKYCLYFYILSVIAGTMFLLTIIVGSISFVKNYKKINVVLTLNWALLMANLFVVYFVNRLLYSMCNNSLQ